jgi:TonB family protein
MGPLTLRKSFTFTIVLLSIVASSSSRAFSQDHAENARKIVSQVEPQYPNMARSMNIRGIVKADVLVAPNGTVKSVEIKGGHPLLAQSAQNSLREWKWESAPHETHETVEVKFTF